MFYIQVKYKTYCFKLQFFIIDSTNFWWSVKKPMLQKRTEDVESYERKN